MWHDANILPLFLDLNKILGGFSNPGSFHRLRTLTEFHFLPEVLSISFRSVCNIHSSNGKRNHRRHGNVCIFWCSIWWYISNLAPLRLNRQHLLHLTVPVSDFLIWL